MRLPTLLWIVLGALLLVPAFGAAILCIRNPTTRPPLAENVQLTPERLQRGKYLVEHVTVCVGCHSGRDWTRYMPGVKAGTEGMGGDCLTERDGVPGEVCARNITPDVRTGIGAWTDGEVMRAIREGVSRDGHALFGAMPYEAFQSLSDEDTRAVVAYLRSLSPIAHEVPPVRLQFPVSLIMKFAPRPLRGPVEAPARADSWAYGKYLATVAGCATCHTQHKNGRPVAGMEFAGGWDFRGPFGHVVSSNLTPDLETGIGRLSKEAFIERFKVFRALNEDAEAPKGFNSVMPWRLYAGMTEEDLGAIYDFLRTLRPVQSRVNSFPDAASTASRKAPVLRAEAGVDSGASEPSMHWRTFHANARQPMVSQ